MNKKRIPIIAGNWKMHNTVAESITLVKSLHYGLSWTGEAEVVVAPPFTAIYPVAEILRDSYIKVAGQDLFWEDKGAYTGAVAGSMLKEAGADYVIIGHSERRQYFNETDETVNKRIKAAFRHQLLPIVCVGETLVEREADKVTDVVGRQVQLALDSLPQQELENIIIAYEPIWAIGTGKTASSAQAEEVHIFIRDVLAKNFGENVAAKVRILYGGSVKPDNSKELLMQPNIDGALVGGASLKAADFIDIIKCAM